MSLIIIVLLIALIGMLLLIILYSRIRTINAKERLNKHRSRVEGFADKLAYAAVVADGIIVCKNGALMAAWLYKGSDEASNTDEYREMVSLRINQTFSKFLGSGWMVHVDAVRRPSPHYLEGVSHFPDPITAAIDEERRQFFENLGTLYEGYFVLSLTYYPPLLAESRFTELMFEDETQHIQNSTQKLIEFFKKSCIHLESTLSTALSLTRLKATSGITEEGKSVTHDDFLRWIQFCITGINQPVILPNSPIYLDALIGGQEFYGGVIPKIGHHFIQVVAIEGFPAECHPGILTALSEVACEYRWSSRFIFVDAHEARAHFETFRKKWKQKIRGFFDQLFNTNTGAVDQDALLMTADAEAAIAEVNSQLVAHGYYTSVIILMNENRTQLEQSAYLLEKAINRLGFAARIETLNTMEAYLGSLPGHGVENIRRPLMNTLNFADLLPTSSIWTGQKSAPCPFYPPLSPALMHGVTTGATPFRLNLHVRDIGHTLMFGPTGAGKSTHLALIAAQLRRYQGMSIFCFDKGMSMYPLCKAIGGQHFTLAADDQALSLCPLQFLASKSDRVFAGEWINMMLALNGVQTTPAQRNEISDALENMYTSQSTTLSDFLITVQNESIREALKPYTVDGPMGHLLDAKDDQLNLSNFMVFEMEELMNLGDKYALPVLFYLFQRIERSLTGQPAAIILDEAWLMLAHPVFRDKIKEWLKVLRKANCLLLMATQSLSDAAHSGILDVIMESTATKIFLPNIYAQDEDAAALYRRMGLNNRQIEIVATAVPKQHYYYVSAQGRRLYELALGPLTLAFVGASDKESIARIRALEEQCGDAWVQEWLNERGVNFNGAAL